MTGLASTLLALAATLAPTHADTVYAGAAWLQNHAHAGDLTGFNTPPGMAMAVGNATTAALGYIHELPWGLSVQVALGAPPTTITTAQGSTWAAAGVPQDTPISAVTVVSPTLLLNAHPLGRNGRWDPFIGVGINYTQFQNPRALSGLTSHLGPTSMVLSDSSGPAGQLGLSVHLTRHWSLIGTLEIVQARSTVTSTSYSPLDPTLITSQATTRIDFHPVVYTLALGWTF